MTLVAFRSVTCIRGGRLLFDSLHLAVAPGEAVQVTGPNGCGKSSLLRLAAGLLQPTSGRIERSVRVALVDDRRALDGERTLADALGWWAQLDRSLPALEAFGLDGLAGVPVRLLSTGQARRARLARVAATGAPLWLLDEPLNGLDRAGALLLDQAIATHLEGGGAVIAASHVPLGGAWRTLALT
ncbi:MAG: heme ABC exporter ATP-binding protein CcmA [Sphingomicrobium sp.]|nr:heme ABC exporter ATP-binding protein CcmA [Sphingomonadales bacterium]